MSDKKASGGKYIVLPEKGEGNFANFHHEDWFAGEKNTRTQRKQWGTLWMMLGSRASRGAEAPQLQR